MSEDIMDEVCCPPRCCCWGPGETCCDCGEIIPKSEPDWQNAAVCLGNARVAYQDDSVEGDDGPVTTVIDSGDLSVVIGLAEHALVVHSMFLQDGDVQKDVPIIDDFMAGVVDEMDHQVRRWGTAHDRGKEPADWFWLVGYLAGKALAAHLAGNTEKALHHTISAAAALGNWHAAITGSSTAMMPGADMPERLSDLEQRIAGSFGADEVA